MILYQGKNRKKGIPQVFAVVFVVLFVCIIAFLFRDSLYQITAPVSRPLFVLANKVPNPFSSLLTYLRSKSSLEEENENLKKQQAETLGYLHAYRILYDENVALRKTLGRDHQSPPVLGIVLAKPPHSLYDTILLDIGEKNGIRMGDIVYAEGMVSIGSIAKVSSYTSTVELYSTPGKKTIVRLEDGGSDMELVGRGGGNFEIEFPRDAIIREGSQVYLPGTSAEIVAEVGPIISDVRDPYKKVLLTSPVNINELNRVYVHISKH